MVPPSEEASDVAKPAWRRAIKSLGHAVLPGGIVAGVVGFIVNSCKESDDRFRVAYMKLGDSYNDIVKSCGENTDIDCYDLTKKDVRSLYTTPESGTPLCKDDRMLRQQTIYIRLMNHFEQAYTLLHGYSSWNPDLFQRHPLLSRLAGPAEDVWPGWERYMYGYMIRSGFRRSWVSVAPEWAGPFQNYMNCLCNQAVNHADAGMDAAEAAIQACAAASSDAGCAAGDAGMDLPLCKLADGGYLGTE